MRNWFSSPTMNLAFVAGISFFCSIFAITGCENPEPQLNPCDGVVCENGGTCLVEGEATRCFCPEGFLGDACELPDDVCEPPKDNPDACWCPGFQGKDCDEINENFGASWMGWMAEHVKGWTSLRLQDIAMPGAHDSASGYLNHDGSNVTLFDVEGGNVILESLPEAVAGWAKTQSGGLIEQLHAGLRFFDLRMVLNEDAGPGFHHGDVYWDTQALPEFEGIRDFLDENPDEILIFYMIHFAGAANNVDGHTRLVDSLNDIFGDRLIPSLLNAPERTVAEILETPGRIMVLYEGNPEEGFWDHERADNLYPLNLVYSKYDVEVNTGVRLDDHLEREVVLPVEDVKVIQAHLQYSESVIQSNFELYIEGYTQEEMSNERVQAWLVRHRDNPGGWVRIVQFDYYELLAENLIKEFANVNRAQSRRMEQAQQ